MGIYERIEPDGRANLNEAEAASDVSAGRQEPGSRRGSMGDDALVIQELYFLYPGQREPALRSVNLTLRRGEFLVLCGPSGCGKTTLLRLLKRSLMPHGDLTGRIFWEGRPLEELDLREEAAVIGFVQQSPENQIVTDTVWHELAFGLESLGLPTSNIRRRVAETASFFGIEGWFHRKTAELSGGQKQLLNLASVMAMRPYLLILDEPTAQLDPIAAARFLELLGRINRELGTSVLLAEHRLEEAFSMAHRGAVMGKGSILCAGSPEKLGPWLKKAGNDVLLGMPAAMRIWAAAETLEEKNSEEVACPVTVEEGRAWLRRFAQSHTLQPVRPGDFTCFETWKWEKDGEEVLQAKELWFAFEKGAEPIVRGLSLTLRRGELLAVLGGNGAGKTTLLRLLAGGLHPLRGEIALSGRVGLLPQDPQLLFAEKTLWEDMLEVLSQRGISGEEAENRAKGILSLCGLQELWERHAYDLSGGEQQRAALAKVLLFEPDILLLDEPTKGFDARWKVEFGKILRSLLQKGTAVLMVSHDMDFCAANASRCALFFDGSIASQGRPEEFFSGGSYYTTAAARIGEGFIPGAVTVEAVAAACGAPISCQAEEISSLLEGEESREGKKLSQGSLSGENEFPGCARREGERTHTGHERRTDHIQSGGGLPLWRKLLAGLSAMVAAAACLRALRETDLSALSAMGDLGGGGIAGGTGLWNIAVLLVSLAVLAAAVFRREKTQGNRGEIFSSLKGAYKGKISHRAVVAAVFVLLLIPLTLLWGVFLLDNRKYAFIALLVLLECMAPFFLIFEGRKPKARELAVIAVLCAAGVAGRAAFFMLPQCKPVLALTILAGAALGGETGFLVGAVTMLASNVFFSQGPLTPWQMFAMGLAGFLAGVLFFRREEGGILSLRISRVSLCVYGALSALLLYGTIMNAASALMWQPQVDWPTLLAYFAAGFPMDCIHAGATVLFLWFGAEPVLEKLGRLRRKYGLLE